jgi:hypothetical protein
VSPELRAGLARALEPDPEARYATPAELREALAATPEGGEAADARPGTTRFVTVQGTRPPVG